MPLTTSLNGSTATCKKCAETTLFREWCICCPGAWWHIINDGPGLKLHCTGGTQTCR